MAFAWRGRTVGRAAATSRPVVPRTAANVPTREVPVPKFSSKSEVLAKIPTKEFPSPSICYWSRSDKVDKLVDALKSRKDTGVLGRTAICCAFQMRCRYVAFSLSYEGISAITLTHRNIADNEADIKEHVVEKDVQVLCLTYDDLFKVKLPDFESLVMVDMPEMAASYDFCFGFIGEVGVKETIVLYDANFDSDADSFLEKAFGRNNNSRA